MLTTDRETIVTADVGAKRASATVRISSPPAITLAVTTASPAGQATRFTVTVTASLKIIGVGRITEVTIDFGDGQSLSLGSLTGTSTVDHVYASPGTYVVVASVTDAGGDGASTTLVITVAPRAPVASFTFSITGLNVSFDATASTGTDLTFTWDFGDGTSGSGATISHTYSAAGTRTVSLTVVDSAGQSNTRTRSVTVP